jgi:arsenate reductase (thioredoxin)
MTALEPPMSAHLEHVVDGLVNATGGAIPRHELREVVFDCYDRLAEHATVTSFLPVLTGRYAMMQVRAMGIVEGDILKSKPEILVVDEHNSARSQTAAALIRFYAPGHFRVDSAGVQPGPTVNPNVVDLLSEVGVRLTDFPKQATPEILLAADHVIAIGEVPVELTDSAGTSPIRWDIPDPADSDRETARAILARIDTRVRGFLRTVEPDHELHPAVLGEDD